MANVKITQLPLATTPLTGTEVFPLVQGTTTKQVSITGLFTDPTMTNPRLGVVGQADLINATGLPIASGVAGLGTGVATFLGTPSSANLRTAVTDETGTGSLVFANAPVLVAPNLGTPTFLVATNATGTALGLIAGSAVTNANLTGAVTSVGNATSLGSFTSAQLATALTDETGSGANVFATSPTLVTPILGTPQSGNFSTGTFTWPTFNQNTTGTASNVTGTVAILNGGTGQTTANGAFNALAPSQSGQSGKYLTTDGTNTSWGTNPLGTVTSVAATVPSFLSIAGSPITTSGTLAFSLSGTALPTTSGGTGLTSFTSGGVVYASSSSALATGSALTFDGSTTLTLVTANATATVAKFRATNYGNLGTTYISLGTQYDDGTSRIGSLNPTGNQSALVFETNTSSSGVWQEGFRLTSSSLYTASGINVGIGLSNPSAKLSTLVANGVTPSISMANTASGLTYSWYASNTASNGFNGLGLFDGTDFRLVVNSSGNLGLGVTPNTWTLGKSISVGDVGSAVFGFGGYNSLTSGAYFNSGWKYSSSSSSQKPALFVGSDGAFSWSTAATGTAGTAISFTQAMTLDASGNLGIGQTSPGAKLEAAGNLRITNATVTNSAIFQVTSDATGSNGVNLESTYYGSGGFGPIKFTTSGTERARIDSSGNLLVGTTSNPNSAIIAVGPTASNGISIESNSTSVVMSQLLFRNPNGIVGSVTTSGSLTSYNISSDYRLKENIAPLVGALEKIGQLKPSTYNYKADPTENIHGFIAHELQSVVPHAVTGEKDAIDDKGNPVYQGVDASFLIPILTAAIQEQQAMIESLRQRLSAANL